MNMKFSKDMHLNEILKTIQEADAKHVFGQPLEKYGKTLIPVGKIKCGYGYGYGPQKKGCKKDSANIDPQDENSGGGGAGFDGGYSSVRLPGYLGREILHSLQPHQAASG